MARKLRVQYPGAIYHVTNRGDRREAIFLDDTDRLLFMAIRLRRDTTMTLAWIAARLRMGTRGHLAHLLYLHEHGHSQKQSSAQLGFKI